MPIELCNGLLPKWFSSKVNEIDSMNLEVEKHSFESIVVGGWVGLRSLCARTPIYTVSQKNRTPITFWNNSNKLCLIIIMISWENRQKVLNIVMCYRLTIFHKTGYQLRKDVDELKQRLVEVWSGLRQTVVDDAIDEWRRRLRACVRVKGQHFEHPL